MDETTPLESSADTAAASTSARYDELLSRRGEHRDILRTRHAQGLARLMAERHDLRGVHALADFVDDALRWTA